MSQRHFIQSDVKMLVTTVTLNRAPIFNNQSYAREAVETLYRVQELHPFYLYGFVIMPDHLHLLMHAPAPQTISKIMNVYKTGVVSNLGLHKIWQPRFHMTSIDNASNALKYIHANPMRKGIVEVAEDYPWSSASGRWDISTLDIP